MCCQLTGEEIKVAWLCHEELQVWKKINKKFWGVVASAPQNYSCVCEAGLYGAWYRQTSWHTSYSVSMFWAQHNDTPEWEVELTSTRGKDNDRKHKQTISEKNRLRVNEWMKGNVVFTISKCLHCIVSAILVISFFKQKLSSHSF